MSHSELLQAVIDLPQLQQYYHAEDASGRVPLRLVCADPACADAALTKFGEPVLVSAERPSAGVAFLEIDRLAIEGQAAAVEFSYPPEGIVGNVRLQDSGSGWVAENVRIIER